jgi:hypothetical protein
MVTFKQAYDAVAARHSGEAWVNLEPRRLVSEIYHELRHLDAKYVGTKLSTHPTRRAALTPSI